MEMPFVWRRGIPNRDLNLSFFSENEEPSIVSIDKTRAWARGATGPAFCAGSVAASRCK